MRVFTCLFTGLITPTLVVATCIRVLVSSSNNLPNPSTLPPSTSATLTTLSTSYVSIIDADNTFAFRNVTSGSYLVDVHCSTYTFPPLRIDVGIAGDVQAWGTFRGNEWSNKGESKPVSDGKWDSKVVELDALGPKNYYQERSGFSPASILKNPMILIAGFGMLAVFGMPYLMDNMDPETKAEFEERQKQSSVSGLLSGQQSGSSSLANFDAAAWLAGSQKKDDGVGPQEKGVSR